MGAFTSCMLDTYSAKCRATVTLKSKRGKAKELENFTIKYLPKIRATQGLERVEFSRNCEDPESFVLYYWWVSPQASADYVASPLYAEIMPQLGSMVEKHSHTLSEIIN